VQESRAPNTRQLRTLATRVRENCKPTPGVGLQKVQTDAGHRVGGLLLSCARITEVPMNGRVLLAAGVILTALAPQTTAPIRNIPPIQAGDIVITGGQLFDGVRDTLVPNTGLIVRRGIFLEAGSNLSARDLAAAEVIRLDPDQTILPGLFDLHAHYAVDLFGAGRVDEYTANPLIFLGNGVTSTFPAGEVDPEGMMAARRRIERGEQIGPRIMSSGPYFGSARPGWQAAKETPDQIRKEVDEWAARGVKGFKAKGIQPAQLEALIDQAHRYGLTVTGHLDSGARNSVNPRDAKIGRASCRERV
jgi:imidazolonepropionase-like amidohydrolase